MMSERHRAMSARAPKAARRLVRLQIRLLSVCRAVSTQVFRATVACNAGLRSIDGRARHCRPAFVVLLNVRLVVFKANEFAFKVTFSLGELIFGLNEVERLLADADDLVKKRGLHLFQLYLVPHFDSFEREIDAGSHSRNSSENGHGNPLQSGVVGCGDYDFTAAGDSRPISKEPA